MGDGEDGGNGGRLGTGVEGGGDGTSWIHHVKLLIGDWALRTHLISVSGANEIL